MMDYKKRYNQAIEAAKRELHCCGLLDCDAARQIFRLFPELRESEDEKIRKELIQYLKDYPNLPNGNYCRDDFFSWLEKQGEKKPSWSEEDSKNLNSVKWIIENSENLNKIFETINSPEYIKKYFINWLKSIKDRVQLKPKQDWSEFDRILQDSSISYLCNLRDTFETKKWDTEQIQKCINWLKSIKPNTLEAK